MVTPCTPLICFHARPLARDEVVRPLTGIMVWPSNCMAAAAAAAAAAATAGSVLKPPGLCWRGGTPPAAVGATTVVARTGPSPFGECARG